MNPINPKEQPTPITDKFFDQLRCPRSRMDHARRMEQERAALRQMLWLMCEAYTCRGVDNGAGLLERHGLALQLLKDIRAEQ